MSTVSSDRAGNGVFRPRASRLWASSFFSALPASPRRTVAGADCVGLCGGVLCAVGR